MSHRELRSTFKILSNTVGAVFLNFRYPEPATSESQAEFKAMFVWLKETAKALPIWSLMSMVLASISVSVYRKWWKVLFFVLLLVAICVLFLAPLIIPYQTPAEGLSPDRVASERRFLDLQNRFSIPVLSINDKRTEVDDSSPFITFSFLPQWNWNEKKHDDPMFWQVADFMKTQLSNHIAKIDRHGCAANRARKP